MNTVSPLTDTSDDSHLIEFFCSMMLTTLNLFFGGLLLRKVDTIFGITSVEVSHELRWSQRKLTWKHCRLPTGHRNVLIPQPQSPELWITVFRERRLLPCFLPNLSPCCEKTLHTEKQERHPSIFSIVFHAASDTLKVVQTTISPYEINAVCHYYCCQSE